MGSHFTHTMTLADHKDPSARLSATVRTRSGLDLAAEVQPGSVAEHTHVQHLLSSTEILRHALC